MFSLLGVNSISWNQIKDLSQKIENNHEISLQNPIVIRAFAYSLPEGYWLLADQPHLKSCCLGKDPSVRILIKESIGLLENRVYTLQGELTPLATKTPIAYFELLHPEIVESSSFSLVIGSFLFLSMALLMWYKRYFRKREKL